MRRSKIVGEKGLSLLEVLVSITLLNIILISLLSFFTQSYQYTIGNQNQTVGINVARNVLYYMEQQDFDKIYNQYISGINTGTKVPLTIDNCDDSPFVDLNNSSRCKEFFSSTINNYQYSAAVALEKYSNDDQSSADNAVLEKTMIPVEVTVTWGNNNQFNTTVRGFIKNE